MDGLASRNDSLLVMGATNAPWDVDSAFRRPGRFDRVLFVAPPDPAARAEILHLHARGRKIASGLPWQQIADQTEHFSGADLQDLLDRACEGALSDAVKHGNMREVGMRDFQRALRDMHPSTLEWLSRAKNYVTYANQDGLYDDLAAYIARARIK
jgi:SpoVK/Ycf46/Vps4 family AAA+-type ATPase